MHPSRVICVAAKWLDQKQMMFASEHHNGREEMLEIVHGWMSDADVIVGYNSRKFDIKHLQRELFLAKMDPPSPFMQVDLMVESKKNFNWLSNKLQWLLTETQIGSKIANEGFPLWQACMDGDDAAWTRMRKYCENDVKETEKLYREMLPWIKNHPSHGAFTGTDCCSNCGSGDLRMEGTAYTQAGQYQRYQCRGCGKWGRGKHLNAKTGIVGIG